MFQLLKNCKSCNVNYLPSCYKLSVRWATKPRWIPVAKSKAFRVHSRGIEPEHEVKEKLKLIANYKTHMKATTIFLQNLYKENETSEEVIAQREKDKEEAWKKCMELNDEWNLNVSMEREQRNAEEFKQKVEEAYLKMEKADAKVQEEKELVDSCIRREKEFSKNYITKDNIDEHIKNILHKTPPQTLNFAIDLQGNVYRGYNMTPTNEDLSNRKLDGILTNVKEDQIEALKHS